jgi:hypothetical protein
LNDAEK